MSVSPPFTIAETLPAASDLISIWPTQENPFRDTVESWLTFLSDPTTGLLKASAFAFPFVVSNAAAGTFFELQSNDAGAAEGPSLSLYRNSASPAVSDILGVLRWNGQDSAANKQEYGHIAVTIADPVSTTEDGSMALAVMVAGTSADRLTLNAAGVTVAGVLTYAGAIAGLTGTGALNSGSITSGFGSIDIGGDPITAGAYTGTTGTFSGAVSMTGLTATTGTFSGSVTAVNGTFSGNVFARSTVFEGGNGNVILQPQTSNSVVLRPIPNSGTSQFYVDTAGNAVASGNVVAFSDRRLKKGIATIGLEWAHHVVKEVMPRSFLRKKDDTRSYGFIAQEVQQYVPELVHEAPTNKMLGLAYPNMVSILWRVVQDLQERLDKLEGK